MLLQDYRKKVAKLSRAKAGAAIGVNGITIWRYESGRSIPEPENIRKIMAWSGGAVTANDFITAEKRVRPDTPSKK